ncbi:MAG: DUF3192 domain-containing protein [Kangiellaceae bacterium]|nr:DUF3192 domain-containing protein [Kangiellaceae bacterium]
MKTLLIIFISSTLFSGLSGCVIVARDHDRDGDSWRDEQTDNRKKISDLQLNTSRIDIIQKLGVPNFSEAFVKEADEYRVLFYRTQHMHSDGDTTKDETTPLVFKNDMLIGWGQDMLIGIRQG